MFNVLCRRTKNNPVVLGDSGVGKTALVEGLAQRVAAGDCPPALKGAAIIALDMGLLMAGEEVALYPYVVHSNIDISCSSCSCYMQIIALHMGLGLLMAGEEGAL